MFYLLLRFAVLLWGLFIAALGIICLQPYNPENDLREIFMPSEGCLVPCLMGIRPGVTIISDAAAILIQRGWTQERLRDREVADFGELDTGQRYFSTSSGRIKLYVRKNVVQAVEIIKMPFHLGDVWLLLGPPDRAYGFVDSQGRVIRSLIYAADMIFIGYSLDSCSASIRELSQAQPEIMWTNTNFNTNNSILEPTFYALRRC